MSRKNQEGTEAYDEENVVIEEEVTEGQDAPKKREQSPRTIAKNAIFSYVTDGNNRESLSAELAALVDNYSAIPGRTGSGEPRNSVAGQIRSMFLETETVHEDKFYELFKIGRTEMKRRVYNLRKKNADPKDNIYVAFDSETGNYVVKGYGEEVPEGF